MQLVAPPLELEPVPPLEELALDLEELPLPPQPTSRAAEPPASNQDSARRRSMFRCIINMRSCCRPWSWSWRSFIAGILVGRVRDSLRAENRRGLPALRRPVSDLCQAWQTVTKILCEIGDMHALRDMDHSTLILVVDDDPELRKLIGDFLAGHGYLVQVAENAAAMSRAIQNQRPDLVILDVMMPGEDGLSAARRLVTEGGPPVIMLSALGSDTDRIIGLEVGADDYLPKPCNPRELLARVRAVLRRRSQPQAPDAAADSSGRFE